MFYRPEDGHGLPHNPFNAIVTPRPIGWISSRGSAGDNLAPYSFFNAVAYVPPQVMFASTGTKDSLRNIMETGVFAVNIVAEAMLAQMSQTSAMVGPEVAALIAPMSRTRLRYWNAGSTRSCPCWAMTTPLFWVR
jgi:flavin reductase (DIM6/NTAB) family NADH-FMN oxidoreductase RutF